MNQTWMQPGTRANWRRTSRGGFGFGQSVAAIILQAGHRRVQIEIRRRSRAAGSEAASTWEREVRWVDADKLSPRTLPCAELGEPLEVKVGGLHLQAIRDPGPAAVNYPEGIWYGLVDDVGCTAACQRPEEALAQARDAVRNGRYRAVLEREIGSAAHLVSEGIDPDGKTSDALDQLRTRLVALLTEAAESTA